MKDFELWLSAQSYISDKKKIRLCDYFGNAKNVYKQRQEKYESLGILSSEESIKLEASKENVKMYSYEKLQKENINFVCEYHRDYPKTLKNIYDRPFGLYYIGRLPKSFEYTVALVGARNCTAYGRCVTEDLAYALSKAGAGIVSGMARGIDSAAHFGAMKNKGFTIAVLGCGVDVCYPRENKAIYNEIQNFGCILSEFPPGTEPKAYNFPKRNRIISGLSQTVIVVEAKEKSGSLITADCALEQGKDVYAVPGRINDPLSCGTNKLIFQGAGIVQSVNNLVDTLKEEGKLPVLCEKSMQDKEELALSTNAKQLFFMLDYEPLGIDELIEKTNLLPVEIIDCLSELVGIGAVREVGKNRFIKNTL